MDLHLKINDLTLKKHSINSGYILSLGNPKPKTWVSNHPIVELQLNII